VAEREQRGRNAGGVSAPKSFAPQRMSFYSTVGCNTK
jgi:hypothetical protein